MAPALVLCSSKAGLAVIRGLGRVGIPTIAVAYGRTQVGISSRYALQYLWAPDPDDDEAAFVDFLLSLAPRWPGAVLFPTDDASLMAVSKHEPRLAAHFRLVAENWSIVRQLLHKADTYAIAHRCGILAPRVLALDCERSPLEFARQVSFPLLLKPSVGHVFFKEFGVKMLLIHSVDELEAWMVRLRSYSGTMMLSEFIPGDDTCGANYNSFYVDGVPVQEFTAAKLRLKPRSIGFPTAVVSRHIPEIIERGRAMIKAIGYRGFSCMEFKRDSRDGRYKLMEINARHNYSGMLALACGLNFPYLSYLQASGRSITRLPAVPVQERYWVDEERDIGGLAAAARKGCRAILSYSRPYVSRGTFAVLTLEDPLPALRLAIASVANKLKTGPGAVQFACALLVVFGE